MDYLLDYTDDHFDLAIIDPPYGIKQDGRKNHTRGNKAPASDYRDLTRYDDSPPDKAYFDQLFRVSKNQIIFGANHFINLIPFASPAWIVWDKQNTGDFADAELAWTSFSGPVRIARFRWNGMIQGDMKNKEKRIHPNQKPVKLYQWILRNYAKPGEHILDTHVGSGSSIIACAGMGFKYTAFEIDQAIFIRAMNRISKGIQKTLI